MPIYQRGKNKTWWIDFTGPNGERVRRSSGTQIKQEAQELHDQLKAETWRINKLGAKTRHTWQEAVIRWLSEQSHKKSLRTDKVHLRWLHGHLNDKYLDEISKTVIDKIKTAKIESGATPATTNRVLSLLRSVLNQAKNDWEWLDTVPNVKLLQEPKQRLRWLTHEEAARLLRELPPHLEAMARFTLATGLRESNVTGLKWQQVDMARRRAWVEAVDTKSGKSLAVPLNTDAIEVIREQLGRHNVYIFTYDGQPVTRANNHAWRKALKRAEIENFRWHDLRHTWASWHIQNGTPLNALKELGGWSDLQMVMRYAHLSGDHLGEYAANITIRGTNTAQEKKKA